MRREALYRLTFRYPGAFRGADELFLIAQGRVEGRVTGRFRGANRARRREDGSYLPDLNGAISTADGATILLRLTGYGQPDARPTGHVVAAVAHSTADERYAWLNGVLGVVAGEVRGGPRRRLVGADRQEERALPVPPSEPTGRAADGGRGGYRIVLDVAEVVWEPLGDTITA